MKSDQPPLRAVIADDQSLVRTGFKTARARDHVMVMNSGRVRAEWAGRPSAGAWR